MHLLYCALIRHYIPGIQQERKNCELSAFKTKVINATNKMSLNGFRLAGDSIHLLAILILLAKLWITRSAAGISGKSQILFTFVFISRYLDLFEYFLSYYNEIMKFIFIVATVATVYSIFIKFRSTYDRTNDAFRFEILVLLAALFAMFINYDVTLLEISWAFSIYLESIAIVPQLYLIYKTRKWETIIKYYLLALGSYRIFYMMNWIWRYNLEGRYDIISITAASFEVFIMVTAVFAIPSDSGEYWKGNILQRKKILFNIFLLN